MTKKQRTIQIRSHNPYSSKFPNYKVVSREVLHLIKYLRERNYKIIVDQEDGRKLCYLAEKGIRELIADPIIAVIKDISLSIAINLFSDWLYEELQRRPHIGKNSENANIVLEIEESGQKLRYSHTGKLISETAYIAIVEKLINRMQAFHQIHQAIPPRSDLKYPITLEHMPIIVGWGGDLYIDDHGLKIGGIEISDQETLQKLKSGELRGCSIGGIVTESRCSVCDQEYVICNHIAGNRYGGTECVVEINGIRIADFSIVKEPVNPETLIGIDYRF